MTETKCYPCLRSLKFDLREGYFYVCHLRTSQKLSFLGVKFFLGENPSLQQFVQLEQLVKVVHLTGAGIVPPIKLNIVHNEQSHQVNNSPRQGYNDSNQCERENEHENASPYCAQVESVGAELPQE